MKDISTSIEKVDAHVKSSGATPYISDLHIDGMLHAKTVRSPHPKAQIVSRQYPSLPDGYYIIDHTDIPGVNFIKIIFEDWPVFAVDQVEHYMEPIALVIGPDKDIVADLVEHVQIEYEPLTPEFDFTNSVIHYHFDKGNIQKAKEESDRTITISYETPYQEQLYIEPQGMIGYYDAGQVTLVGSIQCPYYVKNAVISILDCDNDYVRVKQATVGGAFGGKEEFPSLIACQLAVAIHKLQQPISLIYEREEDMHVTTKRHPAKITLEAYVKDQDIIGMKSIVGIDGGAYIGLSGVVLSRALIASTGAYTIHHLDVTGDVFKTNTVPNGAFRGFGAPQMLFAIEMFIHHVAKEIGIDPLVLRQQHLAKQHDKTSTNGTFRDPIIMPEMLEKILQESNYTDKVKHYETSNAFCGIGMSWFLHGCGFTGSGEATHIKAVVELDKNEADEVTILIAAVDMGQGVKTTMRKLVATILDIPIEQVIYNHPDTNYVPDSGPTVASRTMMIVGGLVARAARKMKEAWQPHTAQHTTEHFQQPKYIQWDEETFTGDAYPAYSWGINVVEVAVDKRTYEVSVLEEWNIYDVGKAIDEQIILGQADGGQLQGLGYGYMEKMTHKDGIIQHKNVTDYIIPTTVDTPIMHNYLMDNPYPLGPYGAKGAGELTLVGGAPAVALAIENAIHKRITKIPVTPEYIMELMQDE
ncbi:xanthine dehydrogenase family protein molybdopterin-binding subunit [Candidatus Xianfuyuplasma coldseepsis]|uniref:Xanthine dehydrogenase family protein n=1 Tax=Candidatus Xianfuyuplasma coldseepsis TaxID=2782163 RepID=A0A7L7KNX8_9MOLU|nr:xanthine dehydrogenase family protein molybdopterin-binding subunit [Xianfuyuplasma coldseepsis]QMS84403.1 xanthine dehydrogenase family protein [Xianfuyuplasma coldseepsis]